MAEETVLYQGRVIPKSPFAVYIYGPDNTQKGVYSWEEYQKEISSGLWYSSKEDVPKKHLTIKKADKNADANHG
jgi:hypothetical protein